MTSAWMAILGFANLILNTAWPPESWGLVWLFIPILLFMHTMVLLFYFLYGYQGVDFFILAVGVAIFISLGFALKSTTISNGQIWGLAMIVALVLYLVCWRITTQNINKKGFPRKLWVKA